MRLLQIRNKIRQARLGIDGPNRPNKNGTYTYSNIETIWAALKTYHELPYFNTLAEELLEKDHIFSNALNVVTIDSSENSDIQRKIKKIIYDSELALNFLDHVVQELDEFSVSIKLPDYNDLNKIVLVMGKINEIFERTMINDYVKADIRLKMFDSGSFWIGLAMGSTVALTLLGRLVSWALTLRKKYYEGSYLKEQLIKLKMEDAGKEYEERLLAQGKEEIEKLVNQAFKDLGINKDPEYFERLKLAVHEISKLVDKGVEFYPSLESSEETKSLFPAPSEYRLLKENMNSKLLEETGSMKKEKNL